jgi:hypothetical protein
MYSKPAEIDPEMAIPRQLKVEFNHASAIFVREFGFAAEINF